MSNPFAKYLEAVQRQDALFGTKLSRQSASVYDDYTPPEDTIKPTKTLDNYIGDTAVDVVKAGITAQQVATSAVDLALYAAGGYLSAGQLIGNKIAPNLIDAPVSYEYGMGTKQLKEGLGIDLNDAKKYWGDKYYSDIRKAQEQELHTGYTQEQIDAFNNEWANQFNLQYQDLANKGANALQLEGFKAKFEDNYKQAYAQFMDKYQTSWDKSLGENLSIMGKAFGTVLDNPSLGVGAAIESTGYLAPSFAVSRGVAALQKAQGLNAASAGSRAIAAGVGEGLVSALALAEQMRGNSPTGTIDGNKVAAAASGGAFTGLVGGVSNRLGSRFGLDDVDSLGLGTQAKGFSVTRPLLATGQEGAEEFVQGIGETVIPNIAEGNDPLQGLAQELALGTVAGNIMGAATNARSLVSGAGSDLVAGFNKVAEAVGKGKDAITAKSFEQLNDPTNKAYDPAKAFNSVVPKLNSQDDREREEALANMESVFTNLDNHLEKLQQEKRASELVLKNYEALSLEDKKTPKFIKEKQDAEKGIKDLEERITIAGNQYGDLYLQKLTLAKNQEVQAGTPQYTEEQAKADIEVLNQAPVSNTVWSNQETDIPVQVIGEPETHTDGTQYSKVSVINQDGTVAEPSYVPTAELKTTQDTTTQQEAVQRITKHFSKLSLDELDVVAKSPYLSEEQRNSLRYLSEAKRAIADLASPTDVTNHIMNGLKGKTPMESHRGLNNYTEMVNTAINTKNEKLLNIALDDLGRFAQDHTDKANALVEANQLVQSGQFSKVQVLRAKDGTWGIVTDPNKFVDDIKLKATAGWNVTIHSNKNGKIDLVTKEATLIQDNLKALTQVGLSFGLQAVEPTVTAPVSTEALKEAARIASTEASEPPVLSDREIHVKLMARSNELVNLASTNKQPVTESEYADEWLAIQALTNPSIENEKILDRVDLIIKLVTSLNNPSITRFALDSLKKAYARVAKDQQEKTAKGQHTSFRKADDPKRAAHQAKLDEMRIAAEEAMQKGLQGINQLEGLMESKPVTPATPQEASLMQDTGLTLESIKEASTSSLNKLQEVLTKQIANAQVKDVQAAQQQLDAINAEITQRSASSKPNVPAKSSPVSNNKNGKNNESTSVTVEALREANKPVVPSNSTDGITSAITRLNKYNKSGTPLTVDSVTPEALQTIQARVYSAFELGIVNQQTYDGVTKDIATLQQYLSSAKPNKQNQEVSKTNTTTQPSTKPITQDISNITENQKTGIWEESQLSNLKRVIDSFVTVNEITPEEYRQGKGSVYERAWVLVKTTYNSTAKHITELMAKGITTVEDIENLTEQLNKLYEYATQSIDLSSDRASLDKLTLNIDSLATVLFSDVDSKLIDEYLKQKEERVARRGDKLLTDRDGNKSFDGRTTEYVFNAPHLQDSKPSSANAVNSTSEQVQVPPTNTALSGYVNHSGGAKGSDIAWDEIGKSYGMVNNNHYFTGDVSAKNAPSGNVKISQQDLEEGRVESAKAAKRNWGYKLPRMKDSRLVRNWAQVKYSDAVYAIGKIVKAGEAVFPNQRGDTRKALAPSVTGGTGYAVGMAINHNKPVYVFNQEQGSYDIGWYKWDSSKNDFVKTDTPVLTKNFAGIGTREINAKGVQAIKDVYAKTQQDNKSVTAPVSGSNTQATKPTASQEVVTPATSTQTEPTAEVSTEPTKDTTKVRGRFTITNKVISDNTVLVTHTITNTGEVTKNEYVTTYPNIYTKDGYDYTVVIYRKADDPKTILDVKDFKTEDKKSTTTSYSKGGIQSDEEFIKAHVEAVDGTLNEVNAKFENSSNLENLKQTEPTASVATKPTKDTTQAVEAPVTQDSSPVVDNSSTQSTDTTTGTSENNESQDTKGNTTTASVSGASNTGADIEQTTNQAEVEEGTISVLQRVTEEVRQKERNKPFSLRNLIKAYFTQKKADASNSPLASIKDFINTPDLLTQVSKYLSDKTKVTDAHIAQLNHFKEFRNKLAPVIQRTLDNEFEKNPKENIIRDMLHTNTLDPNTITAIALAAYGYLLRYGDSVINTDDDIRKIIRMKKDGEIPKDVAELLRYAGQEAPYLEYDLGQQVSKLLGLKVMKDGGVHLQDRLDKAFGNLVTMSLHDVGYIVIDTSMNPKVLGTMLEEADVISESSSSLFEDGTLDYSQSKEGDLFELGGVHPISNMNKMTFIRVNYDIDQTRNPNRTYTSTTLDYGDNGVREQVTRKIDYTIPKAAVTKINGEIVYPLNELVWGEDLKQTVVNDVSRIKSLDKGSGGFLNNLFGTDIGYSTPQVVEPVGMLKGFKQATKTAISKLQSKLITEAQSNNVFTIRGNTVKVLETLQNLDENSKFLKQLLGIWVDDGVLARTYIEDRESLQAKAKNEWRSLENGLSWANAISLGNGEYADFYDTQYIAQNERQHYTANLFNMQTSLIHRAIGSLTSFSVTTKFNSVNTDKNYQRFLQAVGEGLEGLDEHLKDTIKSITPDAEFFTTDKTSGEVYTYALEQYLAKSDNVKAINAMASIIEGSKPSRKERAVIAAFVKAGGMGIQSLQSLIALAEMQIAINQGKDSFTTSVGLGSDGVNNGVATANLLTGVITRSMKQQVGMMPKEPTQADAYPAETMQEVYGKGLPDYYISFGLVMARMLQAFRAEESRTDRAWRDELQALFPIYKAIPEAFIEMRKIAKTWSVPFNYGAGIASLQRALANGFLKGVIKEITGINNEALKYTEEYKEALEDPDLSEQDKSFLTKNYNTNMDTLRLKASKLEYQIHKVVDRDTVLTNVYGTPITERVFNEATGWVDTVPVKVKRLSFEFPRKNGAIDVLGLNDFTLPTKVVESLKQAVQSVHGVAAWNATKQYAHNYSEATSILNASNTGAFQLYKNLRQALIEAKINDKIDEKLAQYGGLKGFNSHNAAIAAKNTQILKENRKLPKDAKQPTDKSSYDIKIRDAAITEVTYLGLSEEELIEIDEILMSIKPMLHSPLSSMSGKVTSGISLVDSKSIVLSPEVNKQTQTKYQDKYSKIKPTDRIKGITNRSGLKSDIEESAGLKALALAVQGMDAYVASLVQARFKGINVHDAYIFSVDDFVEGTKYQNEVYLDGISKYHLGMAHAEAFVNSYLGLYAFSQAVDSFNLSDESKSSLKENIKEQMFKAVYGDVKKDDDGKPVFYVDKNSELQLEYTGTFKGILYPLKELLGVSLFRDVVEQPQQIIEDLVKELAKQDLAKLEALKDLKAVHQYSGDGGAFVIGKGGDISESQHLSNIAEQEKLVLLKRDTLLKALKNNAKTFELSRNNKDPKTELIKLLETNKGTALSIQDVLTILKAVPASAKSADSFEQQLAIIREIEPLLDGVAIVYDDVANDASQGIDDYVQGFYDESTNTITIRANAKYTPTTKVVLHEILHSGLAARITYLENIPEDSKEYAEARASLKQLDSLRKEILTNLIDGVDASKYFELKAAFEKAGGWSTYKEAQKKLKEAKNSAYAARNIRIKTLKELRLKAYEELNAQKAELQAAKNLEQEALDGLRASKFGSLEYQTARLQQQAALAAIKEIKQELQQKYENIASINTELDKLYASNLTEELNSDDIASVELSKKFLTLHSALKNTVFTINGIKEVTALDVVNWLVDNHEFISYGLTEESLQDIMQARVQVRNIEERKRTSLRGYWGAFVKAIGRIVKIVKGESIDALSAFAMDVATFIKNVRESDVPRAKVTDTVIRKSTSSSQDQVNQMSSIEVMQSLPHTGNTDFGLHLNRLSETVIGQLYRNDEVAKAQIDVIQAIQVAPAIKAGFNLSQREAAVQRSLELVLETYMANTTGGANASQLWKIYKEAQKNIKVENLYDGDWTTATSKERAATHQKFKYLFGDNLKGSEALARFVSMALASEEVHNLLGFNTVTAKPSKQKSWFDTVNAWVQYVFAWMGNKLVKTRANDPAYKQLQSLVNNLVALDIRNRQDTVALYEKAWNLVGKVTEPLDKAAQSLRQYATNRDFLRNSKYLPLRTLGSIAALDAKAMGETIPKLVRETRDKARPNEKLGEAMNALMESTAMTQIRKDMEALIRQANLNAKKRQDESDNVKKAIMSWFKDGGKHITKGIHKAITYTLLRTDAQSLLTTFGLNKTIGLLLDTNKLKNEIDLVTKDISRYPNGVDMIHAAEDLGYYMISNKGGMGLSKNPTAIAMGLATNYQIKLEDVDQALVGQLDVLISLFAMKYTSAKDRKVLGEMYKENPEALEGLLQMHKGFMADAATEFKDNPLNYVKGWMPEIVNPYREVATANSPEQRDKMLKEGWKLIEEIKPHGKFLMIHPDIGYQRLVSGAVDLQNSHRKGTEIINRQSKQYLAAVKANLAYTAHRASIPLGKYDPTKKPTGLIPAYDTDGVPLGFNYEMASWVRDKEMERNNNFADLMGAYAGAMFYKPAKRNQSVTVANVLFEDYKQNYQKNPNSYIKLSGKSSDPRIIEMWRMLPKDFRQRATELYGKGEPIIINNEAFLLAFGFKKWTITSIWDKPADQRTKIETMFVTMAESILGDTAKARIAKWGHIWAEIVSKAKDFIVIRSIDVLWNNVLANGLMLMAYGINPVTMVKDWAFITANVRSYQKLHSELLQLKANTLAGKGNDATERQINAIQKQLEANPMNKYINEGLLSSIVEDVTIQQGDYSYDSELKKKIDGVTGWLPDSVKTIGAWAVLSPSTQGYQFLATTTQLSDFVAKVTLAKHLESKGMDFKASVSEASQTFINYDMPQGVGMQYMNDMGLFMFTKFFLRIQAVLFKLLDKKAATVLAQHIATESLTDMQGILDPMALARIGNWPFEEGAFSIAGAAMSIAPVNVVF